ncbi:MAG: NupC/NupG family nucleoside CNT transporter [Phycisphaerales bacterium]|nr:NupC/NupG family nucleoside CNT transporter [Phycisphaerales bacterium]
MANLSGLLGVAILLLLAVGLSTDRRRINWRLVAAGVGVQAVLALVLLTPQSPVRDLFEMFAAVVNRIISFAGEGTRFIFGSLADASGDAAHPWGFVFAVQVLPVIVFFASLMGVLYHIGLMQRVVAAVAWVLRRTLGVTGVEALSASANIFLGQTEAPLCVRPYIAGMTRSQIMAIMTGGFATIAGSVLAAYVGILGGADEESRVRFAMHLMCASVMSAPAGLVMAKIMLPETGAPRDESMSSLGSEERTTRNVLDAAAAGATDGLRLALNVAAMLVAFVALLAMLNYPLAAISGWGAIASWREANNIPVLSFQYLLGVLFKPLVWTFGVPWGDCGFFGSLLGQQLIATEFVAYASLGRAIESGEISPRAAQMATYALCGFANFPSIAIQIGGLSALAPERRSDFASIGLRAMTAGALACWMTACIAGLFIR